MMKKGLCLILLLGLFAGLLGCGETTPPQITDTSPGESPVFTGKDAPERVFSTSGLLIMLTDEFTPSYEEGYTACFDSPQVLVLALKEEFTLFLDAEEASLEDYGEFVRQNHASETPGELETAEGLTYFTFTSQDTASGEALSCLFCLYRGQDAFWQVQFITPASLFDDAFSSLLAWGKSVSFPG